MRACTVHHPNGKYPLIEEREFHIILRNGCFKEVAENEIKEELDDLDETELTPTQLASYEEYQNLRTEVDHWKRDTNFSGQCVIANRGGNWQNSIEADRIIWRTNRMGWGHVDAYQTTGRPIAVLSDDRLLGIYKIHSCRRLEDRFQVELKKLYDIGVCFVAPPGNPYSFNLSPNQFARLLEQSVEEWIISKSGPARRHIAG